MQVVGRYFVEKLTPYLSETQKCKTFFHPQGCIYALKADYYSAIFILAMLMGISTPDRFVVGWYMVFFSIFFLSMGSPFVFIYYSFSAKNPAIIVPASRHVSWDENNYPSILLISGLDFMKWTQIQMLLLLYRQTRVGALVGILKIWHLPWVIYTIISTNMFSIRIILSMNSLEFKISYYILIEFRRTY